LSATCVGSPVTRQHFGSSCIFLWKAVDALEVQGAKSKAPEVVEFGELGDWPYWGGISNSEGANEHQIEFSVFTKMAIQV
jgi:hypothetical protein